MQYDHDKKDGQEKREDKNDPLKYREQLSTIQEAQTEMAEDMAMAQEMLTARQARSHDDSYKQCPLSTRSRGTADARRIGG